MVDYRKLLRTILILLCLAVSTSARQNARTPDSASESSAAGGCAISARSPRLEKFRARGGKMIVPQGASDPVFSLNDTLAWYREVEKLNSGSAGDFVRVFPVPGMAHCGGGPATDQYDAFGALVNWVEKGVPPDRILAKAGPTSPWPRRTRPLCPLSEGHSLRRFWKHRGRS